MRLLCVVYLYGIGGRKFQGSSSSERLRVKYRYKQAIKQAIIGADTGLNEDLYDRLCKKDVNSFWKSWRKRFCSRNVKPTTVFISMASRVIKILYTNLQNTTAKCTNRTQLMLTPMFTTKLIVDWWNVVIVIMI